MSLIRVTCGKCGEKYIEITKDVEGEESQCPNCGNNGVITEVPT